MAPAKPRPAWAAFCGESSPATFPVTPHGSCSARFCGYCTSSRAADSPVGTWPFPSVKVVKAATIETIYVLVQRAYTHDRNLPPPSGRGGYCFPRARTHIIDPLGCAPVFPPYLPDNRLALFSI